jgi:hypothetical protein
MNLVLNGKNDGVCEVSYVVVAALLRACLFVARGIMQEHLYCNHCSSCSQYVHTSTRLPPDLLGR